MQQGQRRNSNSNPRRLSHLVPFVCLLSADVAAVLLHSWPRENVTFESGSD